MAGPLPAGAGKAPRPRRKARDAAYIGTSGWAYETWAERFYAGVPRRDWLAHVARHLTAVEINASFYHLMRRATYEKWAAETPERFAFALKANRYLTHRRRLAEPEASIGLERERALGLGPKLKAVLWQMPARFAKDLARLEGFARALALWPEARHALEFRHPSWFDDETAAILARHRLAVCISDAADWPAWERVTTDLVYVRLHGHERTYASAYGEAGLAPWAERMQAWLARGFAVHAYFDNDAEGAAPYDAMALLAMLGLGVATA